MRDPQQQHQQFGVNKAGKNIRKSPLHVYNNLNQQHHRPPPPRPLVYNISKSDFRSVVQHLTGSPSRSPAAPTHPRPPSTRLHKIRPPPLSRPPPPPNPNVSLQLPRSSPPAASPVSSYMRYLETSLLGPDTSRHPHHPGLLPTSGGSLNPCSLPPPGSAPPAMPSPSGFLNLASPRSPYPLISPTPDFALSPLGRPGPGLQPPSSPGIFFPQSPSGFFPSTSPRWWDMYSSTQ